MRIPGIKRVRPFPRWVMSRFRHRAVILAYHRVADVDSDPYGLCVRPRYFDEQLSAVRKFAHPLSLEELVRGLSERRLPKRAVAVTFDDGYVDNLHNAKPLLARHDVPATVFAVSGNCGREFWWDELNRLLPTEDELPTTLRLRANGSSYEWNRKRHLHLLPKSPRILARVLGTPRQRLLKELHELIRTLPERQRRSMLRQLSTGVASASTIVEERELSERELIDLADGGLIDVGAHTETHPFLALLSPAEQLREIRQSKKRLESLLGRSIAGFSYPHGSLDAGTPQLVREAGFSLACSSRADAAGYSSERFQLPRLWVRNHDGEAFSRWLHRWL